MEYPFVLGTAHDITALVAIFGERRETNHPQQQPSLRRVLHLAISKRPILATSIQKIDPHILLSHPAFLIDLVGRMTIDDLEFVVRRDIGDFHDRPVNSLAYDSNEFVRGIFADVNSRERHDESFF
jgi:hypothetical protein